MSLKVELYSPAYAAEWDALVGRARNGLFLFRRGFMEYHADRFADCSMLVLDEGNLVAAIPVSIDSESGVATSHGGLTFGGLIVERKARSDLALEAVPLILNALRSTGACHLSIRMPPAFLETYPSGDIGYALWRNGFALERRDLSSLLPLRETMKFNSSKKQAVARARKVGLSVDRGGSISEYHALLCSVLDNRHETRPVHSAEELERLSAAFPDEILLRSISSDGEMIAGALLFRYDTAWHTQYLAASSMARECGALDLVIAEAIAEARAAGADWFSFGISTANAGCALNAGLLWQKESFGARGVSHDVLGRAL